MGVSEQIVVAFSELKSRTKQLRARKINVQLTVVNMRYHGVRIIYSERELWGQRHNVSNPAREQWDVTTVEQAKEVVEQVDRRLRELRPYQ